jgi:hypothetical protein
MPRRRAARMMLKECRVASVVIEAQPFRWRALLPAFFSRHKRRRRLRRLHSEYAQRLRSPPHPPFSRCFTSRATPNLSAVHLIDPRETLPPRRHVQRRSAKRTFSPRYDVADEAFACSRQRRNDGAAKAQRERARRDAVAAIDYADYAAATPPDAI